MFNTHITIKITGQNWLDIILDDKVFFIQICIVVKLTCFWDIIISNVIIAIELN